MRRIANQSREDTYRSNRDYQTLIERCGQRFVPRGGSSFRLVFETHVDADARGLLCWGGYALAQAPITAIVTISADDREYRWEVKIDPSWRRLGALVTEAPGAGIARLTLEWNGDPTPMDLWGLGMGRPQLPILKSGEPDLELLRQSHLTPETFYLTHGTSIDIDIAAEASKRFSMQEGSPIHLKKCSYCGRFLPVDPTRLGALAFHKHNAKLTNHQNECRAFKKWRINDQFNPIRTKDQLHESSVITRERKLFLREPEILQRIKERTGAGLKSKVWERFGRKCFRCDEQVALEDYQLDHTRPLAYLWPIDDHATCLCATCNNEKKEKFPVEFYSAQQLARLSRITGLAVAELRKKQLNEQELARILDDLPTFARDWEPRTFLATSRKIRELRPDIDLMQRLRDADTAEFERMVQELGERPPPVDEDC
jgi:hypothetical protein